MFQHTLCRLQHYALILACTLLACSSDKSPARGSTECKFTGGRVTSDLTMYASCSPYVIKGGIDILENVTLTIQPGVEVRFGDGDWLEISAASTKNGRLIARGTAEHPIVLTSIEPQNAHDKSWLGLWLAEGARDSVLQHVTIRAAGGNNTYLKPPLIHGCLTITDVREGALELDHVRLEDCNNAGAVLRKSLPVMHDVVIDNAPIGVLLDGVDAALIPAEVLYQRVDKPIVRGRSTL
jgi:hypothetical protein